MADAVVWKTVKRAAAGDDGARRDLVAATVDHLWALALRLTRRRDEADDVVQETYMRVFATLPGLTPNGRFEGYLARIATNLVLERWRRRRPTADIADAVASALDPEPWQAAADKEDERRRLAAVWQAIGGLAPERRAAVLLYYAQNQPCNEFARILDVPVGTVKTWLHRSRNQVRQAAEGLLRGDPAMSRSQPEDVT